VSAKLKTLSQEKLSTGGAKREKIAARNWAEKWETNEIFSSFFTAAE
jgi:hypothetical protein